MRVDRRFSPELVRRARSGEEAAINLLLVRLKPVLKKYFSRRLTDTFSVDDLVMNTILRTRNGLPKIRTAESFRAFAFKAASYELHDYYRGRYSPKEILPDPEKTPESAAQDTSHTVGLRLDIERALQLLSDRARCIIELKLQGYKYREIAETLDTSEGAVKMQVRRAFAALRISLNE
ncbi:MAG: RNA polymerase sigma factor [Bacteroidota bacterium]|nr:RNA polymerase sigma factor [Bacteroidota bacterium]MDE2835485.1 RNA polymerase sigma factor [Bacteroidota bacterium]MDE2955578.1 RNA polymerase sigma factor [Bacteroidota bacterium]